MVVIGRIDREIFRCIAEDIVTEEVVMTDNQLQHILLSGGWKPVLKVCRLYCESVLRKISRATKIRLSPVGKSANAD